jgi:hypothetical protein
MRTIAAVAVIPIAVRSKAAEGAITVAKGGRSARTRSTSLRTIAAVAAIPVALLAEAAEVAKTVGNI